MLDKPLLVIDLPRMLPLLVDDFRPLAGSRNIALRVDVSPGLRVWGNDELLETAIENVLDNAIDFSPAGSTITVSAEPRYGMAVVRIDDRGPGVSGENLDRIFDRHFSTRLSDGVDGNFGIGLWIVHRNVEVMGGTVAARNRADGGLRIEISLPQSRP
jgi:two-component system sensor histidine kinase ChvG